MIELCAALAVVFPPPASPPKVELTFVFFGCNRIEQKDYEATKAENPSSANLPQLRQNLTDSAKLSPNLLFFGGDLVMNYADDQGQTLQNQLSAWINLVKGLPRSSGTEYVAMPGNHEMNRKSGEQKLPNPITETIWSKSTRDAGLIPKDATGPTPASFPADQLVADQRALSFSFNRGSVHFVVLNTDTRVTTKDPAIGDTKIGMVPTHWLDSDLDKAQSNAKVKMIIVMGHRNVIDPLSCKGDAPIDPVCAALMVRSLIGHQKVRAYICAHVHAFDITPIGSSGLKQVIFGNGGSKLEKDWNPSTGRTFGFGYFRAYSDGTLGVVPYSRPEPKSYTTGLTIPAKANAEFVLPTQH